MTSSLRICLIASCRFPIRQPFAGGLEAHTYSLARELIRRGHEVSLFAASGSDPDLSVTELRIDAYRPSAAARADVGALPDAWMAEHHAYLSLMLDLARTGPARFDVIHNNSLHHLPIAMASTIDLPMITTLHTPPLGMLESAIAMAPTPGTFVSVSQTTATAWSSRTSSITIHNGVDTSMWRVGPGGGPAVWFGRLVPEKAPHHAVLAARSAGVPLLLAGPLLDPIYFAHEVAPLLGDGIDYVGHLNHTQLRALLRLATVALVTPAWDEPYGLVAAEAMACGTPVAAYARGALPELIDEHVGALARPGDPEDLARAMSVASGCDRSLVRRRIEERFSLAAMVDRYVETYRSSIAGQAVA